MIQFLYNFWDVCGELAPWLFFGSIMAALLHLLIPSSFFQKHLNKGISGIIKASLLGVPMPLCSCGVIPAAIGLNKQGASKSASLSFLISTPQTGLDSIFVSASMLSWPFAIFKLIAAFITGILGGLLFLPTEKKESLTEGQTKEKKIAQVPFTLQEFWNFAFYELFHSIWKWLLVGIFISAAIETFLPADFFIKHLPEGEIWAGIFMLFISLPLYVCATASVPVAAALIAKGLPLGAALIFLMAGPASNAATIGAIYRAFGKKFVAYYLAVVAIGSLIFAQVFSFVLPDAITVAQHSHEHSGLFNALCAALLIMLFMYSFFLDRAPKTKGEEIKLTIEGLTCQGCVGKLRRTLQENQLADDVQCVIETKTCTLINPTFLDVEMISKLKELNYQASEIQESRCCSKS